MIHPLATRKITAFLFAIAWLALGGQGTGYGQPPVAEGKIYWTDPTRGIQRANLDGTNVEQIVEADVRRPADIALDLLRGKIYWTDSWNIYWSDLDGSSLQPFIAFADEEEDFNWPTAAWKADEMEGGVNMASGVTSIAVDVLGGKIYWISHLPEDDYDEGYVARANLDGSNVEFLSGYYPGMRDIALDAGRGNVYYAEDKYIVRTDLDGQDFDDFSIRSSDYLVAIALDVDGDRVYWTSRDTKMIQRADLAGQNIEEVLTASDGYLEEIALDVDRGKIYWTNPGTQTIQRADLDGQNIETLFNLEGDVLYADWRAPRIGIALDVDEGKIYWAGSWSGKIQRADLDGQNVEVLFDPIAREPHGIALYLDKIYWTDWMKGTIQRADLDGQNIEVLIAGLKRPMDIALLAGDKIYWTEEAGRMLDIRRYGAGLETGKIQQADLDGANVKVVLTDLSNLGDIALDIVRDKLYWSERFHTIQQADLDGSNVETIVSKSTDSYGTGKMALDVLAGKIYWISAFNDAFNSAIQRANLDGSNVEAIVTIPPEREHWDHYEAFALDPIGNKIYGAIQTSTFSSSEGAYRTGTEFFCSNLDGSNVEEMWRPSFNWWEMPPATTDIALDFSHPTSVSTPDTTPTIPTTSGLSPNFPNPFNASTQIAYDIAFPRPSTAENLQYLGPTRADARGSVPNRRLIPSPLGRPRPARHGVGSGRLSRAPALSRRRANPTTPLAQVAAKPASIPSLTPPSKTLILVAICQPVSLSNEEPLRRSAPQTRRPAQ